MIEALAWAGYDLAPDVAQRRRRPARNSGADARERDSQVLSDRLDLGALRGRRREHKLVVVAAGEQAIGGEGRVRAVDRLRARQRRPDELGADTGGFQDMAEIGKQTVRDVDCAARETPQPPPQLDARLGRVKALKARVAH